nr:unnamed protein product [Digitaria exilis]
MAMASAPSCAVSDLVAKGKESAIALRAMLGKQPAVVGCGEGATPPDDLGDLAEQILRCCDRALAALRGATKESSAAATRKRKPELHGPQTPPATTSKRMRLSGGERANKQVEKKWTMEDGFLWRKYGQKDIHGSKYPRLYFRCSYKEDHGCMARRQVQQSEDDPSVYLINYFGEHTCCRDNGVSEDPESSPEPFVINFGASTIDGHDLQPRGSPWPSSDDDGPVTRSERVRGKRRVAMASCAPACGAASELVARGRDSAAVLQALLLGQQPVVAAGPTPRCLQELTDEILRCCDRALAALRESSTEEDAAAAGSGTRKRKTERGYGPAAHASPATSSNSKRMRVRGGEGATRVEKRSSMEDGFIWRKYGQKEILGSKYPRLYFRCTYKDEHGCMARRQVQQSEDNPSVFLINYFGDHTCCRDDDDERPAPFVINFGSSTSDGQPQQSGGSPWSSCGDDGLQVVSKTPDLCNSPEEELRSSTGNESDEFNIEQSASFPELTSMMSSMEWDALVDGSSLDWPFCEGESLFDDIGEFMGHDFNYFDLL